MVEKQKAYVNSKCYQNPAMKNLPKLEEVGPQNWRFFASHSIYRQRDKTEEIKLLINKGCFHSTTFILKCLLLAFPEILIYFHLYLVRTLNYSYNFVFIIRFVHIWFRKHIDNLIYIIQYIRCFLYIYPRSLKDDSYVGSTYIHAYLLVKKLILNIKLLR